LGFAVHLDDERLEGRVRLRDDVVAASAVSFVHHGVVVELGVDLTN
jgi:hypothetical protein